VTSEAGFVARGTPFDVLVSYRDLMRMDVLGVAIVEAGHNERNITLQEDISGYGRFGSVEIILSPKLRRLAKQLTKFTKAFYQAGYAWMEEFLNSKVRDLESAISIEMYRALNLAFSDAPSLAEMIRLVVIDNDKGVYLFNQRTSENTIEALREQRGHVGASPATMLLGLLTSDVPFEKMFSRHAVASGEFLRCDLGASEYVGSEPIYSIAERVLYRFRSDRPKVATIVPIVRDEQPFLIAAFPSSEEKHVLPILRQHNAALKQTFRDQRRFARQLVKKLRTASGGRFPTGPLFEALGGFTKGALGY